METEEYDAIILAAAGLKRLGWSDDVVTEFLPVEHCLPAVAQGSLGIECRGDDAELLAELGKLTDPSTWQETHAERAFWQQWMVAVRYQSLGMPLQMGAK